MSEPERGKGILTPIPRARFRGPRTPKEIEHTAQQEAEKRAVRMFAELQLIMKADLPENCQITDESASVYGQSVPPQKSELAAWKDTVSRAV